MNKQTKPISFGKDKDWKNFFEDKKEELKPISFGNSNQESDNFYSTISNETPDDFVPLREGERVTNIKNKDSNFVFFFGTSASGKSVILSSMLYTLRTKFGVIRPNKTTPNSQEAMVLLSDFFENIRQGILPQRTVRDQVTRMDLVFEPNNKSKKVNPINLTFLETSGENHNEIRRGGQYHSSISQYLKAEIPISFIIVTSYNVAHKDDTIINDFLFKLESEGKNLKNVNVVLVVSKWDLSGSQTPTGEELDFFIKERLPMTHQFLETNGMDKTYYTIGQLQNVGGNDKIIALNLDAAEILSKWLYRNITGVSLDYEGTFWERLKWSLGLK
ncbi:hypothetical protein ACILE2_07535 [Capnocytophaga canimorsus]|uniref:hypothetical protein n=1 Tax=Capnocytophaga canimorsus TaxID=28188 RepID=UPI0037D5DD86